DDPRRGPARAAWNLNEVGVQSFPRSYGQLIVFSVNTHGAWSTASAFEYDLWVSTTGGAFPDWDVVAFDFGTISSGTADGRTGSFVFQVDPKTGKFVSNTPTIFFLALAPSDKSTLELPVRSTQLGLSASQPRFSYFAQAFDRFSSSQSTLV